MLLNAAMSDLGVMHYMMLPFGRAGVADRRSPVTNMAGVASEQHAAGAGAGDNGAWAIGDRSHPVYAAALRAADGIGWNQVADTVPLDDRQRQRMAWLCRGGSRHGYTFAVRGSGDRVTMASICGDGPAAIAPNILLGTVIIARLFHDIGLFPGSLPGAGSAVELSPRQLDCISRVARGMSDLEIARDLSLSPDTIREYVASARKRFGVKRRPQMVIAAIRHGYLTLDDAA